MLRTAWSQAQRPNLSGAPSLRPSPTQEETCRPTAESGATGHSRWRRWPHTRGGTRFSVTPPPGQLAGAFPLTSGKPGGCS